MYKLTDNKARIALVVILVLLAMMSNPFGRQILFFLLPMGGGIDDLIVILLLGAAFITWAVSIIKDAINLRAGGYIDAARQRMWIGIVMLGVASTVALGLLAMLFV